MRALMQAFFVCLLVPATLVGSDAADCRRATPIVNKQGFRPDATVAWGVGPSPDGTPFPADMYPCIQKAFDAWTRANRRTGLHVRFVPGPGGLVVRFDNRGGLVLQPGKGGGWALPVRSPEGFLEEATIWLSADDGILDNCKGLTKITLHELGHLHGLGDNAGYRGLSVMNRMARKNDKGGRLPLAPTACDALQARHASTRHDRARGRLHTSRR